MRGVDDGRALRRARGPGDGCLSARPAVPVGGSASPTPCTRVADSRSQSTRAGDPGPEPVVERRRRSGALTGPFTHALPPCRRRGRSSWHPTAAGGREQGVGMKLATTTFPVRHLGAIAFSVLVVGTGAGTALADPPSKTHDLYRQIGTATRPDDRAGVRGVSGSLTTAPSGAHVAVRPDDRGGLRGIRPTIVAAPAVTVRPDDRGGLRGVDPTIVAAPAVSVTGGSGFDWGAAGIGAGTTLVLVLIAGSLFLVRGRFGGHSSRGSSTPPALHV